MTTSSSDYDSYDSDDGEATKSLPSTFDSDPLKDCFHRDEVDRAIDCLEFLYRKEVLSIDENRRKNELNAIIGVNCDRTVTTQIGRTIKARAYERLEKIIRSGGDAHSDSVPSDVQSWESAMSNELSHWNSHSSGYFVWFNALHAPEAQRPLQRTQCSRNCYIHAPCLLITYVRRLNGDSGAKMINMTELMRKFLSGRLLHRHIFGNLGGDSKYILDSLLGGAGCTTPRCWSAINEDVLRRFGPALVCRFGVHDGFSGNDSRFQYLDVDVPPKAQRPKGHHAMLLVGVHTSVDGGPSTFLLQNWWKKKQFIECSQAYLRSCGAEAVFIEDSSQISDELPLVDGIWGEAADIDHGEAYDPEDFFMS